MEEIKQHILKNSKLGGDGIAMASLPPNAPSEGGKRQPCLARKERLTATQVLNKTGVKRVSIADYQKRSRR